MKLKPFYIIVTAGFFLVTAIAWIGVRQPSGTAVPGCPESHEGSTVVERVQQADLLDLSPLNRFIKGI